jgi:hypothetical protein
MATLSCLAEVIGNHYLVVAIVLSSGLIHNNLHLARRRGIRDLGLCARLEFRRLVTEPRDRQRFLAGDFEGEFEHLTLVDRLYRRKKNASHQESAHSRDHKKGFGNFVFLRTEKKMV